LGVMQRSCGSMRCVDHTLIFTSPASGCQPGLCRSVANPAGKPVSCRRLILSRRNLSRYRWDPLCHLANMDRPVVIVCQAVGAVRRRDPPAATVEEDTGVLLGNPVRGQLITALPLGIA
jgi:hypothetical protein